jgi:hypothetical protein
MIDRNILVDSARKYGYIYLHEYLTAQSTKKKVAVLNKILKLKVQGNENDKK